MELRDEEQRHRVYDMGGVQEWFGPIRVEANEPVFHHPWEGRVFGSLLTTNAMLGITEEGFRWTEERLPRARYVAGYYQAWLATLEQMAIDRGVLAPGELDAHLAGEEPKARGHVRPGLLKRTLTREVVRTGGGVVDTGLAAAPLPADRGHPSPQDGATAVRDRRARHGVRGTTGWPHAASAVHVG